MRFFVDNNLSTKLARGMSAERKEALPDRAAIVVLQQFPDAALTSREDVADVGESRPATCRRKVLAGRIRSRAISSAVFESRAASSLKRRPSQPLNGMML